MEFGSGKVALLLEGALGKPDLGVGLRAGRNGTWAVTPDARNTRRAVSVCRGSDSSLESRRTSRCSGRSASPPAAERQGVRQSDGGDGRFPGGSSSACGWRRRPANSRRAAPISPAIRACDWRFRYAVAAQVAKSRAMSCARNGFVGEISAFGCSAVEQAVAADAVAAEKLE